MTTNTNKSNTWKTVGISTFVVLALFFVYFVFNNTNTYKQEINVLKQEKQALEQKLSNSVNKDSILYLLSEQEILNIVIKSMQNKLDSISKIKYEKIPDYNLISLDSNVVILSRKLSSEIIDWKW